MFARTESSSKADGHALVIGGSMAGLLAGDAITQHG